jgi:uncharacterized membrane protein YphA (DoxX/SURF4 family)
MPDIDSVLFPMFAVKTLCALFLAITFLQSGLDKVMDFKGNLTFFNTQFKTTALASATQPLLIALAVLEIAGGGLSAIGVLQLVFSGKAKIAIYGAALSGLTVCALLFGQRMSKEYSAAAQLVPYFLVAAIGLISMAR